MKRIIISALVLVMMLVSVGGCWIDGRGGRGGGHDRDRGRDRDGGHDKVGGHDKDGGRDSHQKHEERH